MKFVCLFIICFVSMLGCQSGYDGGSISVNFSDTESAQRLNGAVVSRDNSLKVNVDAPSAPDGPSTVVIEKQADGIVKVTTQISKSHNIAGTLAKINLLQIPMYAGVALMLLSILIFWFLKDLRWAGIFFIVGATMVVGTYLLAQYAIYFMLGLAVVIIYGIYLLYDYFRQRKANDENVSLIQLLKNKGLIAKETLSDFADAIQSDTTKKIVEKVKKKKQ